MLAVQARTRTYPVLIPERREDQASPRHRLRRSSVARALAVAAIVVLPAVVYISQRAQAARTGYAILESRRQIDALHSENARLLGTATTLRSPDRIERIATRELGMRPPGRQQIAAIMVPAAIAAPPGPLAAASVWDRLTAWLGHREAEASETGR